VCPACSTIYKYDAYQVVVSGLRGGKSVPQSVAAALRLFVTLTAPSFGPGTSGGLINAGRCGPAARGGEELWPAAATTA